MKGRTGGLPKSEVWTEVGNIKDFWRLQSEGDMMVHIFLAVEQSHILQVAHRMGNSQSPPPPSCSLFASISTCLESPSPSRPRTASTTISALSATVPSDDLTLLDFKGVLLVPECFYVLSALLQQYYSLFKRSGKAWVYAGHCSVSELGEVSVSSENENNGENVPAVNLVSVISQILEVVQGLSSESEWTESDDCTYFRQRVLRTIYRFHSDDHLLYQQLIGEVFSYMEFCRYRTNLLPALLRRIPQQPLLQRTNKQTHRRYESASFESFAKREQHRTMDMSTMTKKQAPLSLLGRQQDRKRTIRHRKMVHTEGEEFFAGMAREETIQNDSTTRHNPPQRNYISSQFSMNIANCREEDSPRNKAKVKFRKIAKKIHYVHDDQEPHLKRNNTTNQLFYPQESKLTHTKSVLQDLARSVIVRDEPSSRSFIF